MKKYDLFLALQYTAIIGAFARVGRADEAWEIFCEAKTRVKVRLLCVVLLITCSCIEDNVWNVVLSEENAIAFDSYGSARSVLPRLLMTRCGNHFCLGQEWRCCSHPRRKAPLLAWMCHDAY